ncbi:hybrid sensor histidine kinase/response regulator [Hyalangium sp.]|uniref:hybrid sensor histidine kinase/response regulator n=1 Tax=Hyalangium sp. TaxID=2028555 RepID=UPI002D2752F0|nr:hybrid sensor histidine kinase/response regulator [Hyalangium sp.]HYH99251.1 hybrid sensor histidine kinase/response regulator [Hyalangium sp.]
MSSQYRDKVAILLVDDQPEGLMALEATLSPLGQQLVTARSGREALRHLLHQDFAVVLLDVVMPEMDGFETAQLIREREKSRNTPILFLTALSRGEVPEFRAYAVGAVDYLLKPYEPDILRSKVNVFVDLFRKTEMLRRQSEALREAQRRDHERELAEAHQRLEVERSRWREELLRKEMETGRNQQRWLEAVLAALPTPLALLEPGTGHTLFANRAAQELADGCLIYREARQLHPEVAFTDSEGRGLPHEALPAARASRGERLSGVPVEWRHGEQHGAALAFSSRLPQMHGRPETVLLALLDVTALHVTERNLQRAVHVRDDFLSIASHELRTPLTSLKVHIQGALLAAARRNEEPVPVAQYVAKLETLDQNVSRLAQLVDNLLDISRINAGRLDFELAEVDLAAVVREVATRFSEEATRAGCPLTVRAENPVIGKWDRSRVDQVVTNLLTNALKYGAGAPVQLTVGEEATHATLEVRDEGIGIRDEDRRRIFERFERAVPHEHYSGFGLGLWIVHEIVAVLGGSVTVESSPGKGSIFRVQLPWAREPQATEWRRAAQA